DGDGRPRPEVPRSADDLAGLALSHVHLAELEPVRVRVLPGLDHPPDPEELEIAVDVGDAAALDPLDLGGGDAESLRDVVERSVERDRLAEPRDRDAHPWRPTKT